MDKKSVEGELPVHLCNYVDVYYNERIHNHLDFMEATATRDQVREFGLRNGDVIFTKDSETAGDIAVAAAVVEEMDNVVCGYHLAIARARPLTMDHRFLYWCFISTDLREQFSNLATGVTRFGLRQDEMGRVAVPLPSMSRQRAIANFLDRETQQIDALIEKKQRLVSLLGQRQNSAIEEELLSCSPQVIPLRRLLSELPQYGAGETGAVGEDHWPRYIRITDLDSDGQLRMDQILRLPLDVAAPYLLQDGDILIARSGATVGKAFRYTSALGTACFAGYLIRFRFDATKMDSRLVEAWTKTQHYWSQVYGSALQATIQNVSASQYLNLRVPVPSLEDQRRLVSDFARMTADISRLIEINERQISLFLERRQALITEAVTGQLDIPEVSA